MLFVSLAAVFQDCKF